MSQKHSGGGHGRRRPRPEGPRGPRRENISELHPVEEPPDIQTFDEWPLGPDIQRAIAAMDIVKPTPIQALTIGPVLEGRDVIAKAQTGTGKTLAFGAPMMSKIDAARATVLGLVMCPTRELAQQVHGVLATLALPRGVRTALTVGGDPLHPQIAQLQAGAQVVVGTPGRILDLYQQRFLSFPWTEFVVLDEADKMFEIGFIDNIKKILSFTPEERQTLLFSATFPTEVLKLARESTKNPLEVATAVGTVTVNTVEQHFIQIDEDDRPMALVRLLEQSGPKDVYLVFCGRRTEVDRLMRSLARANLSIKALHGGYDQPSRFRVMTAFRTGEVKALIATDVASRGLDVQHVTHVINYDVPRDGEDYAHRIGRTGRAGRSGIAITFVTPHDGRRWREVLARTKAQVAELEAPRRTGSRPERPRREESAVPTPRAEEAQEERRSQPERRARAEQPPQPERRERQRRGRGEGARRETQPPIETPPAERSPREERPAQTERPARARRERTERSSHGTERSSRSTEQGSHGTERSSRSTEQGSHGSGRSSRGTERSSQSTERSSQRPGSSRGAERTSRDTERGSRAAEQRSGAAERAPQSSERPNRERGERTRAPTPPAAEGTKRRDENAPRVQDRSPEPGPRRRRHRRPGAAKPEPDRRDPDGLGRWGNRAEDFD